MKKLLLQISILVLPILVFSQETFQRFNVPDVGDVNDLFVAGNGYVYLATTEGLLEFDGSVWTTYATSSGLPDNDVKNLVWFDDHIYLSTASKGMAIFDGHSFEKVDLKSPSEFGYFSYMLNQGNQLLLGTDNGKVFEMLKGSKTLTERDYSQHKLGTITGMGMASSGVLNILSTKGVLLIATAQNNFEIRIESKNSPLTSDNVISGYMDGDISYDCTDKGITIADYKPPGVPPGISIVTKQNSSLPSDLVNHISAKGEVWYIATAKGFAVRKSQTDWTIYNESNSNLASDNATKVVRSNNGTVWIVTVGSKTVLHKYEEGAKLGVDERVKPIPSVMAFYNTDGRSINVKPVGHEYDQESMSVDVYDSQGRKVYTKQNENSLSGKEWDINLSFLRSGTYFFRLYNEKNVLVSEKFVIPNR